MMPLRIASLLERDMSRDDGVVQKVVAQVTCWQEMGHTAKIFALSAGHAAATAVEDCEVDIEPWRRWRDWLTGYPRLIDRLIRWKPDIVYFRFSSFFPALHRLLRNVPTILEINTSDLDEYRNTMSWKAYTYHRATRRLLLGNARGLVTVTRQLAEAFRPLGKPIVAISNGIDLAGCPSFRAPQNARPRLVFLGQGCMPWHGTDKILHLAGLEPEWDFELIGLADCPLPEISSNVQLLPFLDRKNYRARLADADVGIGPLALHRNAMDEASPLKVREYLACGLPALIAYHDSDFDSPREYLLQLPNTPKNIERHIEQIRQFVVRAAGMRVPRAEIGQLDFHIKERARVEFFSTLL